MAKPRKVEEPAGTYHAAKKRAVKTPAASAPPQPQQPGLPFLEEKKAGRLADKIFAERKDLLRRLAQ